MRRAAGRLGVLPALLLALAGWSGAQAQTGGPTLFQTVSDQGVDLMSGVYTHAVEDIAIGSGAGRLALTRQYRSSQYGDDFGPGSAHDYDVRLVVLPATVAIVRFSNSVDQLSRQTATRFATQRADGAVLTLVNDSGGQTTEALYQVAGGTIYRFTVTNIDPEGRRHRRAPRQHTTAERRDPDNQLRRAGPGKPGPEQPRFRPDVQP